MSELYHECGVAAIYHLSIGDTSPLCPEGGPAQASRLLPRMLQDIQKPRTIGRWYDSLPQ